MGPKNGAENYHSPAGWPDQKVICEIMGLPARERRGHGSGGPDLQTLWHRAVQVMKREGSVNIPRGLP